jgi:hypothetical protein
MRSLPRVLFVLTAFACSASPTTGGDAHDPTPLDTSVYDNCVDFATRLCADSEDCCQQAYAGFDLDGCVASFKREVCRPGADAVVAGKATFDEDAVDACLAAHAEAHAICVPTWKQTIALRKRIYTECHVINGTSPIGRGCSIAATCERPAGNATVECVKNVCQKIEILNEGDACPFPSGAVSVCDDGLSCDAAGLGASGHCIKAPATGDACDASSLESTECGLGSFCDPDAADCRLAENFGGTGCAQSTECVSFDCDRIGNECSAAPAVLSRDTCLGASQTP